MEKPGYVYDFSVDYDAIAVVDMEKTGYVYDFNVDYDAIAVVDIWSIQKYLMKKHGIVKI